jgi:hypothetical protein
MKIKFISVFICFLLISSVLSISATLAQNNITKTENIDKISFLSINEKIGIRGHYKSSKNIPSPDGDSYRCIMFCNNHKQTLEWISLIEESGFEKAWQKNLIRLTTLFIIPGTTLFFGLDDFRNWYLELFIKLKHKDEFLDFLNNYDESSDSGMITYLWLSGITNRPVDFKSQPDNSWIDNSWILDNSGIYIPNPKIWYEPFFWYIDFPLLLK